MSALTVFLLVLVLGAVQVAVGAVLGACWPRRGNRLTASSAAGEELRDRAEAVRRLLAEAAADMSDHQAKLQKIESSLSAEIDGLPPRLLTLIAELVEINQQLRRRLSESEEKLADQAAQIETHCAAARTDPLTRLANRRVFDEELGTLAHRFQRDAVVSTVALIDVDHFKRLNDRWGHPAGDAALCRVADMLRRAVGRRGLVARIGGEEFAVLLPRVGLIDTAVLADRIRAAIAADQWSVDEHAMGVTISVGVAAFELDFASPDTVRNFLDFVATRRVSNSVLIQLLDDFTSSLVEHCRLSELVDCRPASSRPLTSIAFSPRRELCPRPISSMR